MIKTLGQVYRCKGCEAPLDVLDMCEDCLHVKIYSQVATSKRVRATHCKVGHPLTPENTGITITAGLEKRYCLICVRRRANARRAAERERRNARKESVED